MADFGERLQSCMASNAMAIPGFPSLEEALSFFGDVKDAWEASGGSDEILMGVIIASMPFLAEEEVMVLQTVAQVAATVFLMQFASCLASTSWDALFSLNEQGQLPQALATMLSDQGLSLDSAPA